MLDEAIITTCNTLPMGVDLAQPAPASLLLANLVAVGLRLTINDQHNVMDMIGQGQVIDPLSNARHNEPSQARSYRLAISSATTSFLFSTSLTGQDPNFLIRS